MKPYRSISASRDVRRVTAQGTKLRRAGLTIYRAPSSADRVGVALAVRAPGAVLRNRIKRRLRAALRAAAPLPRIDLVVRADEGAATVDFQELVSGLRDACRVAA